MKTLKTFLNKLVSGERNVKKWSVFAWKTLTGNDRCGLICLQNLIGMLILVLSPRFCNVSHVPIFSCVPLGTNKLFQRFNNFPQNDLCPLIQIDKVCCWGYFCYLASWHT